MRMIRSSGSPAIFFHSAAASSSEIGPNGSNLTQPAFVAFAPADHPKIAIAVMVDKSDGGFGGSVAAPIAKAVLQVLLSEGG